MPGLYAAGDYDLAGFCVGAAERGALLPRGDIAAGDAVIGLASSGVHSNGFSLVRRLVADSGLNWDTPAPFSPLAMLSDALLTPTRIYVKSLLAAMRESGAIKALAHITGGGLTENLPRVLPETLAAEIDLGKLAPAPVFAWLAESGHIAEAEMLRTFNCGVGMCVICAASDAEALLKILEAQGETANLIGCLIPRDGDAATLYSGSLGFRS